MKRLKNFACSCFCAYPIFPELVEVVEAVVSLVEENPTAEADDFFIFSFTSYQ